MGSLFHVPIVRDIELEDAVARLRDRGMTILAASADGERSIYETDLTQSTAVVLGNEAHGLSDEAAALADGTICVPIPGRAESLNLAAAIASPNTPDTFIFEYGGNVLAGDVLPGHTLLIRDSNIYGAGALTSCPRLTSRCCT